MKASLIAFVLLVVALNGCGNSERQHQAQEYERFLKESLGTVAIDPPPQARASHSDVGL